MGYSIKQVLSQFVGSRRAPPETSSAIYVLLSEKRPAVNGHASLLQTQSRTASGLRMMFSGALCAISVVVSNLSCLILCSFFASILPTKRNLLTHLNTLLVHVLTALVNVLVSESQKHLKEQLKIKLKNKKHFVSSVAVCSSQQCSRPSPNLWRWPCSSSCFGFRGCYKVFSPLFSGFFYLFSRCSRCSQPHPDLPHPQGKKAGNEFIKGAFFSRRSSTSSTMRNGSS